VPHSKKKIDQAVRDAAGRAGAASDSGAREFMRSVDALRERVVLELAQTGALTPYTAQTVKARISELMALYKDRMSEQLSANQRRLFIKGIQVVDAAITSGDLTLAVPYLSEQTLEQAKRFGAELVTNLLDQARSQIAQQIDLAVLGQKGVSETIDAIGTNLEDPSVFGTIGRRAITIFRTEVNRVQNLAASERLKQASAQIPDLQKEWLHSHVGIPRPGHLLLDGTAIGVDERFTLKGRDGEVYHPMGPHDPALPPSESINCFIGESVVDARGVQKAFRSRYSGELVTIITARGHLLTGTPNHPILTSSGFVALGALQEGGDVLCCGLGQAMIVTDPDVAYVPTTLEEIFYASANPSLRQRVIGAPVDFYGDGAVGEVEIVPTNGFLKKTGEAALEKPACQSLFIGRALRERLLAGHRFLSELLFRGRTAASSHVRRMCESLPLFLTHPLHTERGGFTGIPDVDLTAEKNHADSSSRHIELTGEFLLRRAEAVTLHDGSLVKVGTGPQLRRNASLLEAIQDGVNRDLKSIGDGSTTLSGNVAPDKIIFLGRRQVQLAHVYTLQTVSGMYNNNGILCRNCKCQLLPVVGRYHQAKGLSQ
jgi:hypothetical protein